MGIDKIGPINNYNKINNIKKKNSLKKSESTDSVNISSEAKNMAETNKILEIVKNAPDVRADKVKEIKAKINNPDYINKMVAESLADKIIEALGM